MITDIVEGIADKSESALRHILKAQATLRILVAVPVIIVETILYLGSPASVAARLVVLSILYCVYILALRVLVHFRRSCRRVRCWWRRRYWIPWRSPRGWLLPVNTAG